VAIASAVKVTVIEVADARAAVGVAKAPEVEIGAEAADTVDVVLLPLGVTVKVYDVVRASPVTLQLSDPVGGESVSETTHFCEPPPDANTVYVEATPSAMKVTRMEVASGSEPTGALRAEDATIAADVSAPETAGPLVGAPGVTVVLAGASAEGGANVMVPTVDAPASEAVPMRAKAATTVITAFARAPSTPDAKTLTRARLRT